MGQLDVQNTTNVFMF